MGIFCSCRRRGDAFYHPPPRFPSPLPSHPSSANLDARAPPLMPPPSIQANAYLPLREVANSRNVWRPLSISSSSSSVPPRSVSAPPLPVAPSVEHQSTRTVKNYVNLHKDTIRLVHDEQNLDQYLVSFVYDAVIDGSVTIFYFGREGVNCRFSSIYPNIYSPMPIPFQKGTHQRFCQPSGSGVDLGFFDLDDLSRPLPGDIFPLVIYAEANSRTSSSDKRCEQTESSRVQVTQAVINKDNSGSFLVKAIKQILCIHGERYELQEIFGLGSLVEEGNKNDVASNYEEDMGKECVICLSEPQDTAVLPCRHMCMCGGCAKEFRLQSSKCPICRQPFNQMIEIKVNTPIKSA